MRATYQYLFIGHSPSLGDEQAPFRKRVLQCLPYALLFAVKGIESSAGTDVSCARETRVLLGAWVSTYYVVHLPMARDLCSYQTPYPSISQLYQQLLEK